MAKICINCGCEIPVMGKSLKLKSSDLELCSTCRQPAELLLNELKDYENDLSDIGLEFDRKIELSEFNENLRKLLKKEFDLLYLERYAKNYIVRKFTADFNKAYQIISKAVSASQGFTGESVDTCVMEHAGVKTASFLIADHTRMMRNSFASLAVNLFYYEGEATVISLGASEALGDVKKIDRRLWKYIEDNYPNLEVSIVRKPEMMQEVADGQTVR